MNYQSIFSSIVDIGSNVNPGKPTGVSCMAFDSEQEILWTGNYSGHITSFVSNPTLARYTSFHVDYDSDIRQISTCNRGVLSLTKDTLRLSLRRGISTFNYKNDDLKDLQCMLLKKNNDQSSVHLYMAGNQEKLIEFDIGTEKIVQTVDIFDGNCGMKNCYHLKGHPRFICMGDSDGNVVLRDTSQLKVQHQFSPSTPVSAIDVCGNYLVAVSPYSSLFMIYDLRQIKLATVIQAYHQLSHVKFLSRFTTKCCIVSRTGTFSIVDLTNPSINSLNEVQMAAFNAQITAFDISATDQAFAFGDNHNFIYIHGTCDKFNINTNPIHPEFADSILPNPYYSLMNDIYTPLSEISPFPYYALPTMDAYRQLASYMPPSQCLQMYRPVPPIAPEILRSMRVVGNIGYLINSPGKILPVGNNYSANGNGSIRSSPEGNEFGTDQMPHRYNFLEPNHNKVDKDEYDFSRYNSSPFPGLDSTIPNSYANNMIQCLYFIPIFRSSVINHICHREYCLVCELSFLFHMFDIAPKHSPCQASNFLRAFRTIPEAAAFKLILPEEESLRKQFNFCKLTQQWLRFLLHQLHRESLQPNNLQPNNTVESSVENLNNSFITENFSLHLTRHFQCTKCKHTWKSPYISFPVTLNYPINHTLNINSKSQTQSTLINSEFNGNGTKQSYVSFSELLLSSIHTEQTIQQFCEKCEKLHNNIKEKRLISNLPPIFAINTGLDNEIAKKFWKDQTDRFAKKLAHKKDKHVVTNLNDLEKVKQNKKVITQTNTISCRYGSLCKRADCKFLHTIADENEIDFYSWVPMSIFISKQTDSESLQIKDQFSDWSKDKKEDYYEYCLVNVTSVVKSSEEIFGNIVSAIKIDKSYFDIRRKQLVKKIRRHPDRYTSISNLQSILNGEDEFSDDNDDSDKMIDDNEYFTVDNRNFSVDLETLPYYNSKIDWYLFNHYLINPIQTEEVVSNDLSWKVPMILMYMKQDMLKNYEHNKLLRKTKYMISNNVFAEDKLSLPKNLSLNPNSIVHLNLNIEQPKKGDLVAMDAEFVMLINEETELRSDGTKSTIKPSHKSVARISCVRGSGPMKGIPFIDDYISTQDQVADYMTQFSGIQPGDLDANRSSKNLTTLKSTYLKLRFLLDNGVIFVGHGLRNDFRVINLVVPTEQVIDTVHLFQSPNSKRMVSLRFLAWHFLKLNIQSETHDSIEDAKTALKLYHKYKQLEINNCAKEEIENLYKVGKECGWKIPI